MDVHALVIDGRSEKMRVLREPFWEVDRGRQHFVVLLCGVNDHSVSLSIRRSDLKVLGGKKGRFSRNRRILAKNRQVRFLLLVPFLRSCQLPNSFPDCPLVFLLNSAAMQRFVPPGQSILMHRSPEGDGDPLTRSCTHLELSPCNRSTRSDAQTYQWSS